MKLSAIFQGDEFLGVVPTDQAAALVEESGISGHTQIDNVRVERRNDCTGEDGVVYWSSTDFIDDLQGGSGNTVVKAS